MPFPNLSVYPEPLTPDSGFTGTPGPLSGYCTSGGSNPETGTVVRQPAGTVLPMQPYYFPFVTERHGNQLLGLFDYRPKDTDEAVVAATSGDGGHSWVFRGEALERYAGQCTNGTTNDDGHGHPFAMAVPGDGHHAGATLLYTLDRPTGDTPGSQLLVHPIDLDATNSLAGPPADEPVGQGGSTTIAAPVTTIPVGPRGPWRNGDRWQHRPPRDAAPVHGRRCDRRLQRHSGTSTTFTGARRLGPRR